MRTEKKCLWCRYYIMEYRPDVILFTKEPELVTTLFLGCRGFYVEEQHPSDYLCDEFKWNYEEEG